jgi:hypothetical protein
VAREQAPDDLGEEEIHAQAHCRGLTRCAAALPGAALALRVNNLVLASGAADAKTK